MWEDVRCLSLNLKICVLCLLKASYMATSYNSVPQAVCTYTDTLFIYIHASHMVLYVAFMYFLVITLALQHTHTHTQSPPGHAGYTHSVVIYR